MSRARVLIPLVIAALAPLPAIAAKVTANCTGMIDLKTYDFDTDMSRQTVGDLGEAETVFTPEAILLKGAFGEYRFDLKAGTLYLNGSDTGLYCTYKGITR